MTARYVTVILVIALVIGSLLFQIQMKTLVDQTVASYSHSQGRFAARVWDLRQIGAFKPISVALLAATLLMLWLALLARLDLSVAAPIGAITLVTNAIGGGYILGETPSPLRMIGVVIVALGIGMVVSG